jgi:hypothetical protein
LALPYHFQLYHLPKIPEPDMGYWAAEEKSNRRKILTTETIGHPGMEQ